MTRSRFQQGVRAAGAFFTRLSVRHDDSRHGVPPPRGVSAVTGLMALMERTLT